ncbi:MAG: S1 RNA-binding domain-containing protein [Anaerolineae bacterium]|nr:S1 RNA-binding domain-containing protein [Anaerolineae bacterium]
MPTDSSREYSAAPPPELDEGYWRALLDENTSTDDANSEAASEDDFPDQNTSFFENDDEPQSESDWVLIRRLMEDDAALDLSITGYNRGGLLVEWRSLRGFIPASQLVDFPVSSNSMQRQKALTSRVGEMLHLRIIELSEDQSRLILSERAAQVLPGERAGLLSRIHPGDIVSGVVTNLCDFGAFVDLGGLEGLIHISELSWGRVGHPAEIIGRDQEVRVYVLDVQQDAGRIALSIKRLHPDPWATVQQRYHIGETVHGVITNVVDFGAFARIEDGLEGLIHVSELAEGHFLHPRNVVSEGQEIDARILSIDGRARRLGLTLRAFSP